MNNALRTYAACLDRVRLATVVTLPDSTMLNLTLYEAQNLALRSLTYELEAVLLGKKEAEQVTGSVSYPATWWDAVKDRWFPAWLHKMFPARFVTKNVVTRTTYRVCPHLAVESQKTHIAYLADWMYYAKAA